MLPGKFVSLLLGLVFGGLLLALSPIKVMLAVAGVAVALTLIRFPLWGLLIFAVLATSIPYTTLQLGIRTTVSEAVLGLTWVGVFWQSFIGKTRGFMLWRPTERALMWLMLFSTIPFIWGMLIIHAEGNGPVNWVRWLMNLSM
ncbi:O-antigen ligase domain-containing protein, partial [Pseudomonas carnis]|nr:O-antigen ligase domain-containing protein [Pseudomonas carnis]